MQIRVSQAQENFITLVVGSSINQSINNAVEGGFLLIGMNFVKERRTYELAIYDDEEGINRGEFAHKIFLNRKNASDDYKLNNNSLISYLFYKLVYQRIISNNKKDNNLIINGIDYCNASNLENPKNVTTIEHYLDIGMGKDKLVHVFTSESVDTGIHLGKNNNKINSAKNQKQENAYSWNVKFGFGSRF
ncbi:MAG: hypothetical protein C0597_13780 [Marinilabiliales bacterium]|nr:MAG: hypothetical protein C0597_13780 [Marinilabiliales bacterium]